MVETNEEIKKEVAFKGVDLVYWILIGAFGLFLFLEAMGGSILDVFTTLF